MIELGGVHVGLWGHLEVWALCLGVLALYAWSVRTHGPLFHPHPDDPAVTRRQVVAFTVGILALGLASGSALDDLAEEHLFSAHMVQHLVQALVAPALLLVGTPAWMMELVLRRRRVRATVTWLSKPVVAAIGFNVVLAGIHWPLMVELMLANELVHFLAHLLIVATGLFMWMPVLSPDPRIPRLSVPAQMGYLFLQTFLPTVPASFLTFGDTPLYDVYGGFTAPWGMTALDDMRIAGLIMKIGGGFLLWGIITVKFFRWAADEERRGDAAVTPPVASPTTS